MKHSPPSTPLFVFVLLVASLLVGVDIVPRVHAQTQPVCRIEYSILNKDRYVYGGVDNECSTRGLHSAPFGNWGVDSELSDRVDGRQFEGWCKNRYICDRNGTCKTHCSDSWYEWNSCNFHAWAPPLVGFYNYNNSTQKRSTRGTDTHAGGYVDIANVSCPVDSDGDNIYDSGGCVGALPRTFSVSGHRMELYELDGKGWVGRIFSIDTHVETLRFPTLSVSSSSVNCNNAHGCEDINVIGTWTDPDSPSVSSRKTSSKAAVRINRMTFKDPYSVCCSQITLSDRNCR